MGISPFAPAALHDADCALVLFVGCSSPARRPVSKAGTMKAKYSVLPSNCRGLISLQYNWSGSSFMVLLRDCRNLSYVDNSSFGIFALLCTCAHNQVSSAGGNALAL